MTRVVVACAPFKGTLSAARATRVVADALRQAGCDVDERPLPDGGEGTAAVLGAAWGFAPTAFFIPEVLGQPTDARARVDVPVGHRDGRRCAVIESALCVGLGLVPEPVRDPLRATTRSLGHLLRAVVDAGVNDIVLCLGGTGTVDGGRGLLDVIPSLPAGVRLTGLVDVDAPLAGPDGARRFFAQKGLPVSQHDDVESALIRLHPCFIDVPGAGAAGGLGAAVLALGGTLHSGADVVIAVTGLEDAVASADVVVGGEGGVDVTTTQGKSLWRLRALARAAQHRFVVVCGRCDLPAADVADVVLVLGAAGLADPEGSLAAAIGANADAIRGP
jgi:glycerate 2-kinase